MYTEQRLPASLNGIESLDFARYWNAVKGKLNDLKNLPTWTTNHAMKLGMVVSQLEKEGNYEAIKGMDLEIRKVNDDIAKAWKVKGYIDKYLPDWMAAANAASGGAPVVATTSGAGQMIAPPTTATPPVATQKVTVYQQPTLAQDIKGWVGSWFGGSGVQAFPQDGRLGVLPLVAAAVGLPALAYVVTTGMALWQDYVVKKNLTIEVIKGKLTSGQVKDILTGGRPAESVFEKIGIGVGSNVMTMVLVAGAGYLALQYMATKKMAS